MVTFLHILWIIFLVVVIFFAVTFIVYIFNLDMKLTAALQPMIQKLQEKQKRDQHL